MKREVFIVISIILASIMILIGIFGFDHIKILNSEIDKYKTKINKLEEKENNKKEYNFINDAATYSCTYTKTYRFIDYLDFNGNTPDEYFMVLDKFQDYNPTVQRLTTSNHEKNFAKGSYYEFTYRKTITHVIGNLKEDIEIIKIEKTKKEGLDQINESCILTKN